MLSHKAANFVVVAAAVNAIGGGADGILSATAATGSATA